MDHFTDVKPEEQTDNMSIKWKVTYPVAFVTTPQLDGAINFKECFFLDLGLKKIPDNFTEN